MNFWTIETKIVVKKWILHHRATEGAEKSFCLSGDADKQKYYPLK
jgi:hypothetical protein